MRPARCHRRWRLTTAGRLAALTLVALSALTTPARGQPTADLQSPTAATGQQQAPVDAQPQQELERPSRWGEPTEVRVGIYMIDVDQVDSPRSPP